MLTGTKKDRSLKGSGLFWVLIEDGLEPFKLPRLSLDAIRAPGFLKDSSQEARDREKLSAFYYGRVG